MKHTYTMFIWAIVHLPIFEASIHDIILILILTPVVCECLIFFSIWSYSWGLTVSITLSPTQPPTYTQILSMVCLISVGCEETCKLLRLSINNGLNMIGLGMVGLELPPFLGTPSYAKWWVLQGLFWSANVLCIYVYMYILGLHGIHQRLLIFLCCRRPQCQAAYHASTCTHRRKHFSLNSCTLLSGILQRRHIDHMAWVVFPLPHTPLRCLHRS